MRAMCFLLATLMTCATAAAAELSEQTAKRLLAAYPDQLERIEGGTLLWRDGTRTPIVPFGDAVATGFTNAAANALAVSAALSIVAFLLVFALPKRISIPGQAPAAG